MVTRTTLGVACILIATALGGSLAMPDPPAGPATMQEDPTALIWGHLGALGIPPGDWAQLLTTDADSNGRTDFLDVAIQVADRAGLADTKAELLVYGEPEALDRLTSSHPDAVPIQALDAVFLTAALQDVATLQIPGIRLVVWEPRAYATASSNPAGGNPAGMAQHTISDVGSAWTSGYHGANVRIAILDTGVDRNHQSLSQAGKLVHWKDCVSGISLAYDDHGHGTHVASIAAGNDGSDFKGVADQAKVTGIKVLNGAGSGNIAMFQCGVDHVLTGNSGAKTAEVASMSAGLGVPPLGITTLNGGEFDLFGWDTVANGIPAGNIPFTVAAGNWIGTLVEFYGVDETTHIGVNGVNQVSSPGFSRKVVTVGAVDYLRAPATFTAIGPGQGPGFKPDVVAHGVDTWGALTNTTSLYEQWSGTSMATPVVAGVAALLVGKTGGLSHIAYENALRTGATPACVYAATPTSCAVNQPPSSFVTGRGVVRAPVSLGLV